MSGDKHRPDRDDAMRWIRRDRDIEPTPPPSPIGPGRDRDIPIRPDRDIEPTPAPPIPLPQR